VPSTSRLAALATAALLLAACSSSSPPPQACDVAAQAGCAAGQACEAVTGGAPACFDPVVVQGTVKELGATTPVAGARVVALAADRAPRSDVAASDAVGGYALRVPAPRDATGRPVQTSLTLRADAQGYQGFPGGLRTALPVDLSTAVHDDAKHQWTVAGALTSLELLADAGGGTAWLRGTVARPPGGVGALVVAETAPGGAGPGTAIPRSPTPRAPTPCSTWTPPPPTSCAATPGA
jgi:hypothetical protein